MMAMAAGWERPQETARKEAREATAEARAAKSPLPSGAGSVRKMSPPPPVGEEWKEEKKPPPTAAPDSSLRYGRDSQKGPTGTQRRGGAGDPSPGAATGAPQAPQEAATGRRHLCHKAFPGTDWERFPRPFPRGPSSMARVKEAGAEEEEGPRTERMNWEAPGISAQKTAKNPNQDAVKYVPPQLRISEETIDSKKEELERLKKTVKGLINRLSESNLASISGQLEELYMTNSKKGSQ